MSDVAPEDAQDGEEGLSYVEPNAAAGGGGQVPMLPAPAGGIPDGEGLGEPAVIDEQWQEEAVREHLVMGGDMLHAFIGVSETDWKMSERDLERIAPPLARILNRHSELAKLAVFSDPILLGWGTGLYAYRSVLQARAARMDAVEEQARQAAQERPEEGVWERPEPAAGPTTASSSPRSQRVEAMLRASQQQEEP